MKAKNRKHWTRGRALAREGVQNAMGGGFWSMPVACAMRGEGRRCSAPSQNFSLLAAISLPRCARCVASLQTHGNMSKGSKRGSIYRSPANGQKKTMLPKRGTSSFVVVFLTRGKWVKLPRGEHVTFVCSGFVAPNGVDEFLRHTAAIETIHRVFLEREWYFNGAAIEQAFLHFHFDRGEAGFDILQFHD